jgi:ankyrin repeat protein
MNPAVAALARLLDASPELLHEPIAAALGRLEAVQPEDADTELALAVIIDRPEAARIALEAGADPNAFLPVHAHSTALHQAVLVDDVELLELLVSYGARTGRRGHAVERHAAGLGDPREPPARPHVLV